MITLKSPPESSHFPVMLEEVIKTSSLKKGYEIIDCTFGGGSYSKKFLDFLGTKVIALDRETHVYKLLKELKKTYPC